jgi:hypothetical protein
VYPERGRVKVGRPRRVTCRARREPPVANLFSGRLRQVSVGCFVRASRRSLRSSSRDLPPNGGAGPMTSRNNWSRSTPHPTAASTPSLDPGTTTPFHRDGASPGRADRSSPRTADARRWCRDRADRFRRHADDAESRRLLERVARGQHDEAQSLRRDEQLHPRASRFVSSRSHSVGVAEKTRQYRRPLRRRDLPARAALDRLGRRRRSPSARSTRRTPTRGIGGDRPTRV